MTETHEAQGVLAQALAFTNLGYWQWDARSDVVVLSERAAEIFGIAAGPVLTWAQMRDLLVEADRDTARTAVEEAVKTRSQYNIEYRVRRPSDGAVVWVAARGRAHYALDQVVGMIGIVEDITTRKDRESALEEERHSLQILNRTGALIGAELDLEKLVQAVTDAAVELTHAQFGAFFYNLTNADGESYTLYSLSGAPREAFAQFPMPRNTAVFAPTFEGTGIVRSHDILTDPRYGKNEPYYGMPKGHLPVRSYLAAPVVSRSGEVLGGLFFGHSETGIFNERAEAIVAGIAGQAAIAIDNSRLYQAVRVMRDNLQHEVFERTSDLKVADARLLTESAERARIEGRFQLLVESVVDYAIFMLDPQGIVTNWNTGAERIKGYKAAEIVGRHFSAFYTEADRAAGVPQRGLEQARRNGKFEAQGWRVRKDGTNFYASVVINAIRGARGELVGFAKVTRDVTEWREAQEALTTTQEQLAQSQKMEGIGQLTGGVAHDFNNLLTIIIGNLDMLARTVKEPPADTSRMQRLIDNAQRGAQRAASLTQRLLVFSRRAPLDPKPIDLGRVLTGMSDLLRRSLGERISVETVLSGGLWRVHVDPNQLEVAILNLAVNARDAMPEGGRLTLETANAYLDEAYAASQAEVVPGQYAVICVSDTGAGMTKEVAGRAFEPFFTTKETGHGTGLGLSQVYGFVKQSGGHVKIYSELGQGTTVKIYLPRLTGDAALDPPQAHTLQSPRGGEPVLVVEDEPDVRTYSSETMRELGYTVFEAADGESALRILDERPEIKLLFTDVGLPGRYNGRQLADEAKRRRPSLRILFTTGYARNAIVHDGRLDAGVQLITKPFTYEGLARKLRELLDIHRPACRVLIVEDEPLIQMMTAEHLEAAGIEVEVAASTAQALQRLKLLHGGIDVAVVDLGLPDRRGDILVSEMWTRYPTVAVVFATGGAEKELHDRYKDDARVGFLGKPYLPEALLAKVRELCLAAPKTMPAKK